MHLLWPDSSTTHQANVQSQRFKIIHPFHPLYEMEFDLVDYIHDWREHRLYFYDRQQKLISIPTSWTNYLPEDPFVKVSAKRSFFRFDDLVQLVEKINILKERKNV